MIQSGSIVRIILTSNTTFLMNADQVLAAVAGDLNSDGRLQSVNPQVLGSVTNAIFGTLLSLSPNQPFQAQMDVLTKTDFAGNDDPSSIVANYFETETGSYPSSISTPSITPPNESPIATGEPGANTAGPGGSTGVGSEIADSVTAFFAKLSTLGTSLLIGLVGIVVLALILIAYGPNIGSIARAAA